MLKKIQTQDQNQQLLQDNVDLELSKLQSMPLAFGTMLTSIALEAGVDNLVQHGLNRVARFFIVTLIDVDSNVWVQASTSLNGSFTDSRYINLWCTNDCTVSLWIN